MQRLSYISAADTAEEQAHPLPRPKESITEGSICHFYSPFVILIELCRIALLC